MGTAAYPCPPHEANLSRMAELKKIVGPHVGLSDHTLSPLTASYAVALGATWIEKHFTLPNMRSPDTVVSIDPQGFKEMVLHCEEAALLLGTSTLGVRKCEEPLLGARRTNEQPLRR
jgi:sialic acid synthase SpsE